MGHPIHKHMHTHITKQNVKAAIRDDKAHMDYLKRDVKDDQKFHAADKDARQTADEKHITNLAQDVKYDEKKEGVSRYEYGMSRTQSPLNVGPDAASKKKYSFGEKLVGTAKNIGDRLAMIPNKLAYGGKTKEDVMKNRAHNQYSHPDQGHNFDIAQADMKMRTDRIKKRKDEGSAFFRHTSEHATEEYMARKDAAIKKSKGMSRYSSPVNNITYGDKSGPTGYIGEERYDLNQYNPVDDRAGSPVKNKANGKEHAEMGRKEKFDHLMVEHPARPNKRKKEEGGKATKVIKDRKKTADLLNAKNPPKPKKDDSPAKISAKRAERKAKKGKGFISQRTGGKDTERRFSKLTRKGRKEMKETGMVSGREIKKGKKIKESPANLKGIVKGAAKVKEIAKRAKPPKPQQMVRQAKLAALSGEAAIKGAIAGAAGYLAGKATKKKSPLNNAYENPEYFVPTKSSYGQDMDNFFNTVSNAYANTQTDENRLERATRISDKLDKKTDLSDRQKKRRDKFDAEKTRLTEKIGRSSFDIDNLSENQISSLKNKLLGR